MKKELSFWLLLVVLNSLLFLPGFLITSYNDVLVVNQEELNLGYSFFDKLFYRFNYDVFRGVVEFTLLSIFFLFFKYKFKGRKGRRILFWTYLISAGYLLYFQVSGLVYQVTPLFFNDIAVVFDTLLLFAETNFSQFVWGGLSLLFVIYVTFYGIRIFWNLLFQVYPQRISKILTAVVLLFTLLNMKFGTDWKAQNTFIPLSVDFTKNIYKSFQSFLYVRAVNPGKVNRQQPRVSARFNTYKPNIHFVILESYGEVLNTNPNFHSYKDSIFACDKLLRSQGWGSVSTLSEAPMNGGNSKVSYGSLLYGFDFTNSGIYSYFYRNKKLLNTNHWGNHLKRIGYTNYLIDAIDYKIQHEGHWDNEKRFYAFKHVIGSREMNYKGNLVNFGPSVLGQYAYGFALKKVKTTTRKPVSTFFFSRMLRSSFDQIKTHNSWKDAQQTLVENPKTRKLKVKLSHSEYLKAELYQIGYLTKTLMELGDKNDVFIIMGDHQPFFYTTNEDSRRTPIHIITKNKKLLATLKKKGFLNGLSTDKVGKGTKHHLIYKTFMKAFYSLSK